VATKKLTPSQLKELNLGSMGKTLKEFDTTSVNLYHRMNHLEKPQKVKKDDIETARRIIWDIFFQFKRLDNLVTGMEALK